MSAGFSDSIDANIELLRELIDGLPPSERPYAKRAMVLIGRAVSSIRKDTGGNVAAGMGVALALVMIAKQLLESDEEGERGGLIELLS